MRLLNTLIIFTMISACNTNNSEEQSSIIGKTIFFPPELIIQIKETTINNNQNSADYLVINIVDTSECTSCNLKLRHWNNLINEFNSIENVKVNFLTIINTPNKNEIISILRRDNYLYPICIDQTNCFNNANNSLNQSKSQTLLLNSENKVIAIGNPVTNPKIKQLYKKIITGNYRVQSKKNFS